jgi:hypothetical protein
MRNMSILHYLACAACITAVICHGCPAQVTVCTYSLVPVPAYVGYQSSHFVR